MTPEPTAKEGREDALYKLVFDAGHQSRENPALLTREFGLSRERARELVAQVERHDGNARCGILARELDWTPERVQGMVYRAARRDSWRIAGLEPPASLRAAKGSKEGAGGMGRGQKMNTLIAGVLPPKTGPQQESGQCAAGSACAHPELPLEPNRRKGAKYHRGCKQRAYRSQRSSREPVKM